MEEMQQITIEQWMSWREDIREKLKETAGNFVYIGYRLKQIRDSGMYGGAEDIFAFAQKEYGLGKSTVSRFIAINEKFSEGGNSTELKAEYSRIGSSKLAEMLTLTDSECRLITEQATVKDIRDLKNFSRQQADGVPGDMQAAPAGLTPLQKCIVEYFRDKKSVLNGAIEAYHQGGLKTAAGLINPAGYATYKKGLIFLFLYDYSTGVKYKQLGREEAVEMSWEEFLMETDGIFGAAWETGEDPWEAYYRAREEGPEKAVETCKGQDAADSVATSQQASGTEETVPQEELPEAGDGIKDGESQEACGQEDPEEGQEEEQEEEAGQPEAEEELPEAEYDPYRTEGNPTEAEESPEAEDGTEEDPPEAEESPEAETPAEREGIASRRKEETAKTIAGYRSAIQNTMKMMQSRYDEGDWAGFIEKAKDAIWRAEHIRKLEEDMGYE